MDQRDCEKIDGAQRELVETLKLAGVWSSFYVMSVVVIGVAMWIGAGAILFFIPLIYAQRVLRGEYERRTCPSPQRKSRAALIELAVIAIIVVSFVWLFVPKDVGMSGLLKEFSTFQLVLGALAFLVLPLFGSLPSRRQ